MNRVKKMAVERLKFVDDGFSDSAPERWEHVCYAGMKLEPLSGRELLNAQQMQSQVTHKGMCRYFPGANSQMRLTYHGRTFNVESVVNYMEQSKFLDWRLVEDV